MYNKSHQQENNNNNSEFSIPDNVLNDLCSRFIINVPEEDRNDLIRVFFQIEIAHWFYLDFYCDDSTYTSSSSSSGGSGGSGASSSSSSSGSSSSSSASSGDSSSSATTDDEDDEENFSSNLVRRNQVQIGKLKPCSIRQFAALIFRYCPYLMQHSHNVDDILSDWRLFKHAVPTNGAIILDEQLSHVLLVQGYWAKASWGFPKGKVNEHESEWACARREVLEETGFDIEPLMQVDDYLQIQMQEQTIRLYIVHGVAMKTKFEPRTRKEIKEVRWFPIHDLPMHRKDHRCKHRLGFSPNSFFMVIPFVKSLKQWIAIQNGTLQTAQLINGSIVHNAKTPSNNNTSIKQTTHHSNASITTTNNSSNKKTNNRIMNSNHRTAAANAKSAALGGQHHRRRNSHSHSSTQQQRQMQPQLHHHHHQQNGNSHYYSLNYESSSPPAKQHQHSQHRQQQQQQQNSHHQQQQQQQHLKVLSRSNENLASSNNTSTPPATTSKTTPKKQQQQQQQQLQHNVFLKHFAKQPASSIMDESSLVDASASKPQHMQFRNQIQYVQKVQQEEISDLLSLKENLNNTTNNNNNNNIKTKNLGQYSKFKPVISSNSQANSAHKNKIQQQKQQQRRPMSSTCKELQFSPVTPAMKSSISFVSSSENSCSTTQSTSKSVSYGQSIVIAGSDVKAKKHLDFSGPECWINFKFDYDSISPPIALHPIIQL